MILRKACFKWEGVKDRLGDVSRIHQPLQRGYPYPSAQGVGPLLNHDNPRNVNDLQIAPKSEFASPDRFNERMQTGTFRRPGCRNPIRSRVVSKIKDCSTSYCNCIIFFNTLQSQIEGLQFFPIRRKMLNQRAPLALPHTEARFRHLSACGTKEFGLRELICPPLYQYHCRHPMMELAWQIPLPEHTGHLPASRRWPTTRGLVGRPELD
jgi:hypothetical protein